MTHICICHCCYQRTCFS